MGDNNTGLLDNAAKKAAESVGNRVGNAAVDAVIKVYSEAQVLSGSAFTLYLKNAISRYSKIKTIATGTEPRPIIGENALYVHIGVKYRGKEYSTLHIENLLSIGNHLFVEGTGGAGKSMLMRYLFLDTAYAFLNRGGTLIPVLLELRRLNTQASKDISAESLLESVYSCMREFDAQLDIGQVESSLRKGKLLLLLDGFDEVPEALARKTADAIHRFCSGFSKNPCVVTSRPNAYTIPLETFSMLESMNLTKSQAKELASRIWDRDEKTEEFCDKLENVYYDDEKYTDFAQNPLLLTMMFLTFMRNGSIPEHLSEFYHKAYEALYSVHDNQNKGIFKREFKCKALDEKGFSRLFAYFCFQSYFKDEYEFTEQQLLGYLDKGIKKLALSNVSANAYLADLQDIVCMIVKDGEFFRFSHRSFQAYFAARYTSEMTDDVQKRWFEILFSQDIFTMLDYCDLLFQIEPERFAENALEEGLRTLQEKANASSDPDMYFLTAVFEKIHYIIGFKTYKIYYNCSPIADQVALFDRLIGKKISKYTTIRKYHYSKHFEIIRYYLGKIIREHESISFDKIGSTRALTDEERIGLYQAIFKYFHIASLRSAIWEWLAERDAKREKLNASTKFSNLLDAL